MHIPWFLLLPAVAFAQMSINVKMPDGISSVYVEVSGTNVNIISDEEIKTFGLTYANLLPAIYNFVGGQPRDIFLKSPTPWGDLYKKFHWNQVRRTLFPRSAKILNIYSNPVVITTHEFINRSGVTAKYNAHITQQVEQTVSTTWSTGGELTIGQEINLGFETKIWSFGSTSKMEMKSSWGKDEIKSKTVTVGTSSGVEVELKPGDRILASLHASRGYIEIQVDYTATVAGSVSCNYPDKFKDHYFYQYDVKNLIGSYPDHLKDSVNATEVIKIEFYSDARVVIDDIKRRR